MRTNIDIDDDLMAAAMAAGPFKTKREAVEAGLRMLEKQAAVRELLKLEGKLDWGWEGEERLNGEPNWSMASPPAAPAKPAARAATARKPAPAPTRRSAR